MRFLLKIAIKIISYALGILIASSFAPGFTFSGDWRMLLLAGIMLTVLHTVILPILRLLTFPLALITFGLFHVVLNALVLWAAVSFIPGIHIASIASLFFAVIVMGIVGIILSYI